MVDLPEAVAVAQVDLGEADGVASYVAHRRRGQERTHAWQVPLRRGCGSTFTVAAVLFALGMLAEAPVVQLSPHGGGCEPFGCAADRDYDYDA